MTQLQKIVYVDAMLEARSGDCLFEETQSGLECSQNFKALDLRLERVSLHPDCGLNPRFFFESLVDRELGGLLLSGSEKSVPKFASDQWVADYLEGLKIFLPNWIQKKGPYPILGICFAHQAISHAQGGKVFSTGSPKIGPVRLTPSQENFQSNYLKTEDLLQWNKFIVYHEDQVSQAPKDFIALLKSDYSPYQAFIHKQWPLITVQFHPEMNEKILDLPTDRSSWQDCKREDFKDQKGAMFLATFGDLIAKMQRQI